MMPGKSDSLETKLHKSHILKPWNSKLRGVTFVLADVAYTVCCLALLFPEMWSRYGSIDSQKLQLIVSCEMEMNGLVSGLVCMSALNIVIQAFLHVDMCGHLCFELDNISPFGLVLRLSVAYCIRAFALCCLLVNCVMFGMTLRVELFLTNVLMIVCNTDTAFMITFYIRQLRLVKNSIQSMYLLLNVYAPVKAVKTKL